MFNRSSINGRAGFKGIWGLVAACAIATLVLAGCGTGDPEPQGATGSDSQFDSSEPASDRSEGGPIVEPTEGVDTYIVTTAVPYVSEETLEASEGDAIVEPTEGVDTYIVTTAVPYVSEETLEASEESGAQAIALPDNTATTMLSLPTPDNTATTMLSLPTPDNTATTMLSPPPPDNTTTTMLSPPPPPPPPPPATTKATSESAAFTHPSPTTTLPMGVVPPPPQKGDVFYKDYGVNIPTETALQPYSTFGLDTDTASWFRQFLYLDEGVRPPPEAIRAEEIVNAFPGPLRIRVSAVRADLRSGIQPSLPRRCRVPFTESVGGCDPYGPTTPHHLRSGAGQVRIHEHGGQVEHGAPA